MFSLRRISGKPLADLCHRLAISAESGIDIRQTWQRETENANWRYEQDFARVTQSVEAGNTLTESLVATGEFFPRLFLEMVDVGEKTGSLPQVLHRLSDHYQRRSNMNRALLVGLSWPLLQLGAAVVIIGVLLAVLNALGAKRLNGEPIDILGLGVTGTRGLTLYIQMVVGAILLFGGLAVAASRGALWLKPVQRFAMRLPGIGRCLQQIAMARIAWILHLTLNVEMDLRRIVPLALRSTGNDYYARLSKPITDLVAAGSPLNEAFRSAGVFPAHFTDALQVAEESGQIVESMSRLSHQYEEEAQRAMQTLTTISGFAILFLVIGLIVWMIIRLFKVLYLDMLNDAMNF